MTIGERSIWRARACRLRLYAFMLLVYGGNATAVEPVILDTTELFRKTAVWFRAADCDVDQQLTLDEFLASTVAAGMDKPELQFKAFQGTDGTLNRAEFIRLVSPTDERREVGDPIVDMQRAALAKWQAVFASAGGGGGHGLTPSDWPGHHVAREIRLLADVEFNQWDRDGNGTVELDEGVRVLEIAFGLTQPDGRPLRTPSGRVFRWFYFRKLDGDQDGAVSRREFVRAHNQGAERNVKIFSNLDADGDGRLKAEETLDLLWPDILSHFFLLDSDGDGYMTRDDFLAIGWGASIGRRSVRAFDDDGDGKISFREFRGTTFANQASDWHKLRKDADDDGRLSWEEFYLEKPPLLIAQARWLFGHFDLDDDGFLSPAELEFDVNLDRVPTEAAFAALDLNGDRRVVFDEFFVEKRPAAGGARDLDRYELGRGSAEARFLLNDTDESRSLDLIEFTKMRAAPLEAARRRAVVRANREAILRGSYRVRKAAVIVMQSVLLAIVLRKAFA